MTDTLTPVECTNWALSTWNSIQLWAEIGAHLRKNRLKRLKIKRGTTSKVNYILFNRLLSMVPLNKSGLIRAKPGNFILKSLNRCFSNYYQVRTWPVFAETVTYISGGWVTCPVVHQHHCSILNFHYCIGNANAPILVSSCQMASCKPLRHA